MSIVLLPHLLNSTRRFGMGGGAVEQMIVDGLSVVASKFDTELVSVSRKTSCVMRLS
jgi:hypothetical protein